LVLHLSICKHLPSFDTISPERGGGVDGGIWDQTLASLATWGGGGALGDQTLASLATWGGGVDGGLVELNAASIKLTSAVSPDLVATSEFDLRGDGVDQVGLLGGRRMGGFQPLGVGGRLESAGPWGEGTGVGEGTGGVW
jgi:hypothetical protein